MEGIQPTLQIIPFDHQVAVKASITIPQEQQHLYVNKSFLLCVIQLRSALTEKDIDSIKRAILDMCQQLLSRNGIDYIGFIINEQYWTIRNPNYLGIKDLLNQKMKISDTTDFKKTLQCLRHSIYNERQKLSLTNLTLFVFSSNVAYNPLNPSTKNVYNKNQHLPNYFQEIRRLRKTIRENCLGSCSYILGYIKKYQEPGHNYLSAPQLDGSLLYQIQNCTINSQFYDIVTTQTSLNQKLNRLCSIVLYEFHEFSVMIPVNKNYTSKFEDSKQLYEMAQQYADKSQQMEPIKQDQDEEQLLEQIQSQLAYFMEQEQDIIEQKIEQKLRYAYISVTNIDEKIFRSQTIFMNKTEIDLNNLHQKGYYISKKPKKIQQLAFPIKKKLRKLYKFQFKPQYNSKVVYYHQPTILQQIQCRANFYKTQLNTIIKIMMYDIVKYKKRYIGNKKYQYYIEVNLQLQHRLRQKVIFIENIAKEMMSQIFDPKIVQNQRQKTKMFELYSSLKVKIDATNQTLMHLLKKQIKNEDIGALSRALSYDQVRGALQRKLIKRVNSNFSLIDDTYDIIEKRCVEKIDGTNHLQAKYHEQVKQLGNCMYSLDNFVKAIKSRDALGIVFQLQRPDTAIADPGRIRIRQISPLLSTISKFFQIHQYGITESWHDVEKKFPRMIQEQQMNIHKQKNKEHIKKIGDKRYSLCSICFSCNCTAFVYRLKKIQNGNYNLRYILERDQATLQEKLKQQEKTPLIKYMLKLSQQYNQNQLLEEKQDNIFSIDHSAYTENWDYWNRVQNTKTYYGIMPLYICEENWDISKHLMKLCMGWNACGQPLGYSFSQYITIPYMIQSSLIRSIQQMAYKVEETLQKLSQNITQQNFYTISSQINMLKHKKQRFQVLLKYVQKTCQVIMKEQSSQNKQQKLADKIIDQYKQYMDPINRTVDVISNNSCFLGQLYTVIQANLMQLPNQKQFHEFFKRLIEEQLRRETDGWNEEQIQDKFQNRLLNAKIDQMDKPIYVVSDSIYKDRFQEAFKGAQILKTQFQIYRQNLQMMIKQGNSFNDTQRMILIEYKRLYENRVLWFWFVRFRLYQQIDRKSIHKWKCLDLSNSYKLFTLIIQNKKQRKNWKRRQAIQQKRYVDPFDYYKARDFLQKEFTRIRNKKQAMNIMLLNNQKYGQAATAFSRTRDIDEAAGALMNVGIGQQINFFFQELLYKPSLLQQKLKLLLLGQHKGISLMKQGWLMSRKKMNLLRKKFPHQFLRYQYMF